MNGNNLHQYLQDKLIELRSLVKSMNVEDVLSERGQMIIEELDATESGLQTVETFLSKNN
jgi:hypothetical protein